MYVPHHCLTLGSRLFPPFERRIVVALVTPVGGSHGVLGKLVLASGLVEVVADSATLTFVSIAVAAESFEA